MKIELRWLALVAALVVSGCSEDDTPSVDAPVVIDSPPGTPDAPIDAPARACNGSAYDPCTDTAGSTDCMPGMECRLFMMQGFTICTPTCNAGMPCPPDENGTPVACNTMGRCRSSAPNTCTPPP